MEHAHVYRLWQAPFAEMKFAPVLAKNNFRSVRRILDVGCGPGTNAPHFAGKNYTGIDCNPAYIDYARRHHSGMFVVADATTYRLQGGDRFDFILLNSFLHHIDHANATAILAHLRGLLTDDGHLHILELLLPEKRSLARLLAQMDRGNFPRSLPEWLNIAEESFQPVIVEPYELRMFGTTLWKMVYLKCRAKI